MPQVRKVDRLPPDVRKALDKRLIENGFGGYRQLSAWLRRKGYSISHNSIHGHGQELKRRLEAMKTAREQATAIAEQVGDDPGHLNDAIIGLVQTNLMQLLVKLEVVDVGDLKTIKALGHVVADLARASTMQKRFGQEFRAEVRKQALIDAAAALKKSGKKAGISEGTLKQIEEHLMTL